MAGLDGSRRVPSQRVAQLVEFGAERPSSLGYSHGDESDYGLETIGTGLVAGRASMLELQTLMQIRPEADVLSHLGSIVSVDTKIQRPTRPSRAKPERAGVLPASCHAGYCQEQNA